MKKVRNITRKITCLLLAAVVLFGMAPATVYAAEDDEVITFDTQTVTEPTEEGDWDFTGLYDFTANPNARIGMITKVSMQGKGTASGIYLTASVNANEQATQIGVKNIIIQKKVSFGWQNVATSAGGYATNASDYTLQAYGPQLEVGQTYRILSTHYAYLSNGYTEVPNQTNEFVYAITN